MNEILKSNTIDESVPELPCTMMSDTQKELLNYHQLRNRAMQGKIPQMTSDTWKAIIRRVPAHLQKYADIPRDQRTDYEKAMVALFDSLSDEIKGGYDATLRKLMVANTILPPSGVERDDNITPKPLPENQDFSTDWREAFEWNRRVIEHSLVITHPLLRNMNALWYSCTRDKQLVSCKELAQKQREEGFLYTAESFMQDVSMAAENFIERLNLTWYTETVDDFSLYLQKSEPSLQAESGKSLPGDFTLPASLEGDGAVMKDCTGFVESSAMSTMTKPTTTSPTVSNVKPPSSFFHFRVDDLYMASEAQMQVHLSTLLQDAMTSLAFELVPSGLEDMPTFTVKLVLKHNEMTIDPSLDVFTTRLQASIKCIQDSCRDIITIKSWLAGTAQPLKVILNQDCINKANENIARYCSDLYEPIQETLNEMLLFNHLREGGEKELEVSAFLKSDWTFEALCEMLNFLDSIKSELLCYSNNVSCPSVEINRSQLRDSLIHRFVYFYFYFFLLLPEI